MEKMKETHLTAMARYPEAMRTNKFYVDNSEDINTFARLLWVAAVEAFSCLFKLVVVRLDLLLLGVGEVEETFNRSVVAVVREELPLLGHMVVRAAVESRVALSLSPPVLISVAGVLCPHLLRRPSAAATAATTTTRRHTSPHPMRMESGAAAGGYLV
ncbi:hypothetical protein OROGR_008047 [Orobanche gracilis]